MRFWFQSIDANSQEKQLPFNTNHSTRHGGNNFSKETTDEYSFQRAKESLVCILITRAFCFAKIIAITCQQFKFFPMAI